MHKMSKLIKALLIALPLLAFGLSAAPTNFQQAKILYKNQVYFDQNNKGTFYCGCKWSWKGQSGGRINHQSCGYKGEGQHERAKRLEAEHVLPISHVGKYRQCWQNGGRKNCNKTDPVFNAIEADMHNLTPAVGSINAYRSNYNFGVLPHIKDQFGACDFKVDVQNRIAEPRDEVKGQVARIYFYMHDRYDIRMSRQQQQLMMAWDKMHPVDEWERTRDLRIKKVMGHSNPFVTGESKWSLNHVNSAKGVVSEIPASHPAFSKPRAQSSYNNNVPNNGAIRGNKNSRVYHLPSGCPSYNAMSPRNIVEFASEQEATNSGFRKAGNCR